MGKRTMWSCPSLVVLLGVLGASGLELQANASTTTTPASLELPEPTSDKIARRIIDDRLTLHPKPVDFAPWSPNRSLLTPLAQFQKGNPPARVTEDLDDIVTDKPVPKKIRTVGPSQEPGLLGSSGAKSQPANGSSTNLDKEKEKQQGGSEQQQQQQQIDKPAPRFHGNRPLDDRYGSHGWRTSSYFGYGGGKDKNYYDQRNSYPYDRYNSAQRPNSNYASTDADRYGTSNNRPNSNYVLDGDRFGSSTSNSRPGNYQNAGYYGAAGGGYGDRPRPGIGSGYGISGNINDGETDYPFGENGGPPGNGVAANTNLQTQKAVALKALAGVALIGAAAALASNPVLLPISVISGRRKRSADAEPPNYALTALLQGYIKTNPNEVVVDDSLEKGKAGESKNSSVQVGPASPELVISPQCVARLACHVHRDYLDELEKSRAAGDVNAFRGLEHWFDSLIHSNILVADYLSDELKALIQSAVAVGSNRNASCDVFSCLNVQDSSNDQKNN